jgi:CRISPR-associated protein Csm5
MVQYEISVESPVHIGSGEKLGSMDLVVQNGRVFIIDFNKVLSELKNKGEDPLVLHDEIERFGRNFSFGNFLYRKRIDAKTVSRTSFLCQAKPNSVSSFIKNAFGIPLLPGSSLKGAIRTALIWYFLKDESIKNEVETTLQEALRTRERKIGQQLENLVFYGKKKDPQYDMNKAVTVADASFEADLLKLALCKTFTVKGENRLVPKHYDIYVEAVMPRSEVGTTDISLNSYFLEEKLSEIGFSKDRVDLLREFPRICNEFSKNLIEYELEFFECHELPEIVQFYEKLLNSLPETNDEFLMRLGSGVGWISTTIGLILEKNPDLLRDIRETFRMGKRKSRPYYIPEFPKTRKLIVVEETPKYPLGWIRLVRKP